MCGCAGAGVWAADKPNLLWITSEDTGPHLGCYGDAQAVTPHLDALAQRSLRFTQAWSNAPVCAPARTTVISGLYPPSAGAEHMRSLTRLPAGFRMFPQFLREAGYYCTNHTKEDYNLEKPGQVWDESSGKAHWKNRGPGQPFFAVFNYTITHESQIRNAMGDENRIHDPGEVRVPAYHPDTPEVRRDWAQYHDRITMMDDLCGKALRELEEAGLAEDTIVFYWGDHGSGMPRNKRWPYDSGLRVPLILHVPEKWKPLAPQDYAAGGQSSRLVAFVDLAPTLLSLAGIQAPDWMQGRAFAGKYATAPREYNFGFRGRMDERYDLVRSVTDGRYVYLRQYLPHLIYGQFIAFMFETPTTRVWRDLFLAGKLNDAQSHFWRPKPCEELYDLTADRDEVNNLAADPAHAEVLAKMRQAHADQMAQVRDLGLLPEAEVHARARQAGVSPYEMGHDPKLYDFDRIFAAAQLASAGRPEDRAGLVKLLGEGDSGLRYWGAMGLRIQGREGVAAAREELVRALGDVNPSVQIAAAEALGLHGEPGEVAAALDVLLRWVDPARDAFAALAAWNALDAMDERARPVAEKLAAIDPQPVNQPVERIGGYAARLKEKTLADLGMATPAKNKSATKKKR